MSRIVGGLVLRAVGVGLTAAGLLLLSASVL
jgi:hypothetical protein